MKLIKNEEPTSVITNATVKAIDTDKSIQYISNGKLLDTPHVHYYMNMLNLNENINDLTIENATRNRQKAINKEYNDRVLSSDLEAAKFFLLDQWAYLTSYN